MRTLLTITFIFFSTLNAISTENHSIDIAQTIRENQELKKQLQEYKELIYKTASFANENLIYKATLKELGLSIDIESKSLNIDNSEKFTEKTGFILIDEAKLDAINTNNSSKTETKSPKSNSLKEELKDSSYEDKSKSFWNNIWN